MQSCVDYYLGVLVLEKVYNLERLVKRRVSDVKAQPVLIDQLTAVRNYLKHGYHGHLDKDDDVAHDSRRAIVGLH